MEGFEIGFDFLDVFNAGASGGFVEVGGGGFEGEFGFFGLGDAGAEFLDFGMFGFDLGFQLGVVGFPFFEFRGGFGVFACFDFFLPVL